MPAPDSAIPDEAHQRMRLKIVELRRALVGRFGEHHALMLRLHLSHIDHLDDLVAELDRTTRRSWRRSKPR